ncbi:hypothetical protein G5V59_05970 [Nocardioides sp. W3-2-3]|uniref:hypothetical protein n=1 Tax=Nocardioides convexus TaxID=2712224 RepID=UPI00241821BA|nr:hypothetical protein [Nocardioides convexus]NGZ99942.1 hypothetical protein [Nocardioides convexus]
MVLCWIAIALAVGYLALRRERTLRAWLFLASYLGADYVLLLTTRAQVVGAISGTEYRYLTDAMCAVVLALGLATMEPAGRRGAEPRAGRAAAEATPRRGAGRAGAARGVRRRRVEHRDVRPEPGTRTTRASRSSAPLARTWRARAGWTWPTSSCRPG